jgi:hypothetical protein
MRALMVTTSTRYHDRLYALMSAALYRKNAAACYELARASTNEDEKVRWIVLAQDWLERADVWQASGDPPADQSTAQVGQQQQQIQPEKKEE